MTLALILISFGIYVILKLAWMISPESVGPLVEALALPANPGAPWWHHVLSPVTYIFTHIDFWHLLLNSLWLGWFGAIFGEVAGRRWILPLYLCGGCIGAAFYMGYSALSGGLLPEGTFLVGGSAATLGIISSTIIITPGRRVKLMLIGTFPLKWIAVGAGVIFVLASLEMEPGQTAAHAGGLLTGIAWGAVWLLHSRRNVQKVRHSTRRRLAHIALVNKVRDNGYDSLTRQEKLALFNLSRHSAEGSTGE